MVRCVNHGWVRGDIPKEYPFLGEKGLGYESIGVVCVSVRKEGL